MKYCNDVIVLNENNLSNFNQFVYENYDGILLVGPTYSGKTYWKESYLKQFEEEIFCNWDSSNIIKMLWSDGYAQENYFHYIEQFEDSVFERYNGDFDNKMLIETSGLTQGARTRKLKLFRYGKKIVLLFFMNDPANLIEMSKLNNLEFYKDQNFLMRQLNAIEFPGLTEVSKFANVYFITYENVGDFEKTKKYFNSELMYL